MISLGTGGKSKSKSKQESKTYFPKDFFDDAYGYFGGPPDYDPEFVGFGDEADLDRYEGALYNRQKSKMHQGYQDALKLQNEDLSNMGMLNSPSKFIEGGARDTLNKGYIQSLQQAANEAALGRLGREEREAGRRTTFNQENALAMLHAWLQRLGLSVTAGRESSGSGSQSGSGGFSFGISSPFKPGGN
jgi:hypothetical protein